MRISDYGRDALHTVDGISAVLRYIDFEYDKLYSLRERLINENDDLSDLDRGRYEALCDIISVYAINSK